MRHHEPFQMSTKNKIEISYWHVLIVIGLHKGLNFEKVYNLRLWLGLWGAKPKIIGNEIVDLSGFERPMW